MHASNQQQLEKLKETERLLTLQKCNTEYRVGLLHDCDKVVDGLAAPHNHGKEIRIEKANRCMAFMPNFYVWLFQRGSKIELLLSKCARDYFMVERGR